MLACADAQASLQVISVDVPKNLELEVTETTPGVKGNTVSGGTKAATLETGAVIQVRQLCYMAADQMSLVDAMCSPKCVALLLIVGSAQAATA